MDLFVYFWGLQTEKAPAWNRLTGSFWKRMNEQCYFWRAFRQGSFTRQKTQFRLIEEADKTLSLRVRWYSNVFFYYRPQILWKASNQQWISATDKCRLCLICVYPRCQSSAIVQKLLKTRQWYTRLHWVTCSSIIMGTHTHTHTHTLTHTGVYFDWISHTLSGCREKLTRLPDIITTTHKHIRPLSY